MEIRSRIKELRSVRAGDLVPNPANWRVHNPEQLAALKAVVEEIGFAGAILTRVLDDGRLMILDGHARQDESDEDALLPVLVTDLTEEEGRKLLLTYDPIGAMAGADREKLGSLMTSVQTDNGALRAMLDDLARQSGIVHERLAEVPVPEPPDAAVTQLGDLIILGDHRLLCGDSSSPADLDRLLDGAVIHLCNTDPPYNVKVEPRSNNAIAAGLSSFQAPTHHQGFDHARRPGTAKATGKMRAKDRPLENDFVSDKEFDVLLDAWFGNIARVLEPGRAFYIWGGYANIANYPAVLKKHDLYFSQAIIWVKGHPVLTRKDFMGAHEWSFYGWRLGSAHQYYGPQNVPDVWAFSATGDDTERTMDIGMGCVLHDGDGEPALTLTPGAVPNLPVVDAESPVRIRGGASDVWFVKKVTPQRMVHLTEKPVELAARAMYYSSRPGEHVLDLFGGSGSTLCAAEQMGRRAFLMELDPAYCDVIVQRWEQMSGKKAVRERVADQESHVDARLDVPLAS